MSHLRVSKAIVTIIFALLLLPAVGQAIDCPTRQLPRPEGDPAQIRAALEAEGKWHTSDNPMLSPPADPQVGDTWLWYVWDLGGFPVANLKPCTVRGMGDHCYLVVDDDEWNVTIDQEQVDNIVNAFENQSVGSFPDQGVWELNTSHFGPPPNPLDGLDRVFLFYYRFNISSDGFFWAYDQFPDGSQAFASNECEVIYMATDSGNSDSDYMIAVMAHEFEHMLHYNQDANELSWVDEGLGELAMWLYGNPDVISSFNSQPDINLTSWSGAWADYIKTYLWSLYVYEQYGGQPTIWELIHNPTNSMTGYQQTLDGQGYIVSTSDVFADWGRANYLDDVTVEDGRYGYLGDDLPPFTAWRTHGTYPATGTGSIQPMGTDYIRLQNAAGPLTIRFDGLEVREYRFALMAVDPALPTIVLPVPLDELQAGEADFGAAEGYQEIVLAVANVSAAGTGAYTYWAESSVTSAPGAGVFTAALANHPNPFNPRTEFAFTLPRAGLAELTVLDVRGRRVAELVASRLPAGDHRAVWSAEGVSAGTYLGRLVLDGKVISTHKVAVVK
jgi:hypothetical protein